MAEDQVLGLVQNIDARLTRVEQILPTLATRDELHDVVAPLATREELLATRQELHAAIQAAIAPLATRKELHDLRDELYAAIKEEGDRSRRYTSVLIEDVKDDTRIILEHLLALSARVDEIAQR